MISNLIDPPNYSEYRTEICTLHCIRSISKKTISNHDERTDLIMQTKLHKMKWSLNPTRDQKVAAEKTILDSITGRNEPLMCMK